MKALVRKEHGFAHHALLVALVVIIGIASFGTYNLVMSNANSYSANAVTKTTNSKGCWLAGRVWKDNACTRTCRVGAGPSKGAYCDKAIAQTISKAQCLDKLHRVFVEGAGCARRVDQDNTRNAPQCQTSHPLYIASAATDYCKATTTATTTAPKPTTTTTKSAATPATSTVTPKAVQPQSTTAAPVTYDGTVRQLCERNGRAFVAGKGCAKTCVAAAGQYKTGSDKVGYCSSAYTDVALINKAKCEKLHRRWSPAVPGCARSYAEVNQAQNNLQCLPGYPQYVAGVNATNFAYCAKLGAKVGGVPAEAATKAAVGAAAGAAVGSTVKYAGPKLSGKPVRIEGSNVVRGDNVTASYCRGLGYQHSAGTASCIPKKCAKGYILNKAGQCAQKTSPSNRALCRAGFKSKCPKLPVFIDVASSNKDRLKMPGAIKVKTVDCKDFAEITKKRFDCRGLVNPLRKFECGYGNSIKSARYTVGSTTYISRQRVCARSKGVEQSAVNREDRLKNLRQREAAATSVAIAEQKTRQAERNTQFRDAASRNNAMAQTQRDRAANLAKQRANERARERAQAQTQRQKAAQAAKQRQAQRKAAIARDKAQSRTLRHRVTEAPKKAYQTVVSKPLQAIFKRINPPKKKPAPPPNTQPRRAPGAVRAV